MKLASLVLLAACGGPQLAPTPAHTNVLAWELAQSDRSTIRSARIDGARGFDTEYTARPTEDTVVKLVLHVETATVEYEEDGEKVVALAPVKLAAKVLDSGGFVIEPPTCMGPHYHLDHVLRGDVTGDTAPKQVTLVRCTFRANLKDARRDYGAAFTIQFEGDGRISDGVARTHTLK